MTITSHAAVVGAVTAVSELTNLLQNETTTGQTAVGQSAATNQFQIMESCIIVVLQIYLVYSGVCFIFGS